MDIPCMKSSRTTRRNSLENRRDVLGQRAELASFLPAHFAVCAPSSPRNSVPWPLICTGRTTNLSRSQASREMIRTPGSLDDVVSHYPGPRGARRRTSYLRRAAPGKTR